MTTTTLTIVLAITVVLLAAGGGIAVMVATIYRSILRRKIAELSAVKDGTGRLTIGAGLKRKHEQNLEAAYKETRARLKELKAVAAEMRENHRQLSTLAAMIFERVEGYEETEE